MSWVLEIFKKETINQQWQIEIIQYIYMQKQSDI